MKVVSFGHVSVEKSVHSLHVPSASKCGNSPLTTQTVAPDFVWFVEYRASAPLTVKSLRWPGVGSTSCSNIRNNTRSACYLRSVFTCLYGFLTHTAIIFLYHHKVVRPCTEHNRRSMWEMGRCGSTSHLEERWSIPLHHCSTNTSETVLNREARVSSPAIVMLCRKTESIRKEK
jgi:hypothetical protein